MIDLKKLERILPGVQKPARYTGGELGEVKKDITADTTRFAFCFPDVYEVGMSHTGTSILYHLLNNMEGVYAERCFCPWPDMEQALKNAGLPLFSLETKTPLNEFDIVGFSLSYEMCYTNVLAMLSMAGIPLRAAERSEGPVVIAGGGSTYNPEPAADFFDIFVIGEAEESLPELIGLYRQCKREGFERSAFLRKAAGIGGIYVPSLYDIAYSEDGTIKSITAKEGAPKSVQKRIAADFDASFFPCFPIVPYLGVVHDRVTLEIMRGCTRGCRFCQAGMVYRPVRERKADRLIEQAKESIANTGHEEVSLCSLSTGDYSEVARLVCELTDAFEGKGVSVAVPSLRIDSYEGEYAQRLKQVRNTGLTFAPEAGTQRLRDIINKNITDDDIYSAVKEAFESGTNGVKLYFMIGLPGETDEDVKGIAHMAAQIRDIYYGVPKEKRRGGFKLTVSVSNFVPKPHTPFQWEPQDSMDELNRKQRLLKDALKYIKGVTYNWHDSRLSMLEAVFSRGDRKLSWVLEEAFRLGCRFDSWMEWFDFDKWTKAFETAGISTEFYANRERGENEIFPWGMIDTGVSREFLWSEKNAALAGATTPDCREGCLGCGLREAGLCV
ncbi:MAG: TIGR03960 family B12-binding radical SAM protein [Burkholderiales bacterium]